MYAGEYFKGLKLCNDMHNKMLKNEKTMRKPIRKADDIKK